jgi:small membrane protein
MWQQIIALFVIIFLLYRQFISRRKGEITLFEFIFWTIFWLISILAIIFLKSIDQLVNIIGFSSSGINVLLYVSIVLLFYYIFKLRLKIEKINKDITRITREIALSKDFK